MRNVIIDCDPGHDDAVALMVTLANPAHFNVLGITTVAGNTILENATKNVLEILEYLNISVPVSAGYEHPLLRKVQTAAFVHGESGMDGPVFPPLKTKPTGKHAIEFMKDAIESSEEKVTIIALGPLTNVGIFLKTFPQLKEKIETIVVMGGAIYGGNILPKAEFNIFQDPEAAKMVFESGCDIIMAPIEVCDEGGVLFTEVERFKNKGKANQLAYELFDYYGQYCARNGFDRTVIYDMTPIIYLMKPELFETQWMNVTIECGGESTRGMTVCDFRGGAHVEKGLNQKLVLTHVDRVPFVQVLFDALDYLDAH